MRVLFLAGVMGGMALRAAPPATVTPEQGKLLREGKRLWDAGLMAWKAGKQEDAIALLEKLLVLETRLLGRWHRDVEATADQLSAWHHARGEWARLAASVRIVSEARARLDGPGHWSTVDARANLEEALARPNRTRE